MFFFLYFNLCSGLETFWQSAFAWFFRPMWIVHDHLWTMEPTELPPSSNEWPWHSTTYSAKIRFRCNDNPNHGWTSKKGRVVFWYRIRRQGDEIICQVLFKLYGQQCCKCMQQTLAQQVQANVNVINVLATFFNVFIFFFSLFSRNFSFRSGTQKRSKTPPVLFL